MDNIISKVKSQKFSFREKTLKELFYENIKSNECSYEEFKTYFIINK